MGSQLKIHQLEMKVLIVLAAALVATQALDLDSEWESFKIKYGKNLLTGQEHDIRKNIFAANLKFIEKHNAEHALGLHTFTVGINQFADLTNEEFVKQFTGFAAADDVPESSVEIIGDRPESIDWREEGAVTPVKNQGQCGSCWAFSTIGTIEGAHFKETGKLVSLSEQNLMDCSRANYGCNGGFPYEALRYVINNGGVDTEESYPYEMRQGYCRYNENNIGAKISQAKKIVQGSEEDLQNALGSIGPISVAIDASHYSFQLYHSGVYHEPYCSPYRLDHGVLAVGYGSDNGQDYYIVKNSWGPNWGLGGYIKMSRNRNNQCGIATMACYAVA